MSISLSELDGWLLVQWLVCVVSSHVTECDVDERLLRIWSLNNEHEHEHEHIELNKLKSNQPVIIIQISCQEATVKYGSHWVSTAGNALFVPSTESWFSGKLQFPIRKKDVMQNQDIDYRRNEALC